MTLPGLRLQPVPPATLANHYCRFHHKFVQPGRLFDRSWDCESTQVQGRLEWCRSMIFPGKVTAQPTPLFGNFIERMALISPAQLQSLLCSAVLLSRRESFRHCINGAKIRTIHEMIGTPALAALLKSRSVHKAPTVPIDWTVPALLGEGFALINRTYSGQRSVILDLIRFALPRDLPDCILESDEQSFEKLVVETHKWYPELQWLFG